jgi:glucose-1-phosphate cytidylyltransferase
VVDLSEIVVVILAGGRGARFDHESQVLPKPMIPVVGKPILEHLIESLESQGLRRFIVAAGYLGDRITQHFRDHTDFNEVSSGPDGDVFGRKSHLSSVVVVDTGEDSHTGKRLGLLYEAGLLRKPYLLTYGDGLSDVSAGDVVAHHRYYSDPANRESRFREPYVTMTAVNPPDRFGVVRFHDGMPDGLVQDFGEKPPSRDWINGGFMYVDPRFVPEYILGKTEGLPDVGYEELESFAMRRLSLDKRLLAKRYTGYWRCMDTRRDLEQIEADVRLANDLLPWRRDMMWTE